MTKDSAELPRLRVVGTIFLNAEGCASGNLAMTIQSCSPSDRLIRAPIDESGEALAPGPRQGRTNLRWQPRRQLGNINPPPDQ